MAKPSVADGAVQARARASAAITPSSRWPSTARTARLGAEGALRRRGRGGATTSGAFQGVGVHEAFPTVVSGVQAGCERHHGAFGGLGASRARPPHAPWWSTTMRSHVRRSSGRSDEAISDAIPAAAASASRRGSPPWPPRRRRGSGRRAAAPAGWRASQRLRITFCWLPPDSPVTLAAPLPAARRTPAGARIRRPRTAERRSSHDRRSMAMSRTISVLAGIEVGEKPLAAPLGRARTRRRRRSPGAVTSGGPAHRRCAPTRRGGSLRTARPPARCDPSRAGRRLRPPRRRGRPS